MERSAAMPMMGWGRFAGMIAVSNAIMFPLVYQLVYEADHVLFSVNRLLASLAMGCVMTAVMLAFMWKMYRGQTKKVVVLTMSLASAALLIAINRSQTLVGDTAFMRAMIPHHSIAINNASRARITDPRVRELADGIIERKTREIAEMKRLIADIEVNGSRGHNVLAPRPAASNPRSRQGASNRLNSSQLPGFGVVLG
jgi:hypothetical protein